MFTQERANFVLWNHRQNMADTTYDHAAPGEETEEEPQTEDEEEVGTVAGMSTLLGSMRNDQNEALAQDL